jgi:hypothetical protein
MDDQLVSAEIAQGLYLDRVSAQRRQAVLVRPARGFGVLERGHVIYQYRLPLVPVPDEVDVEGSPPDAVGVGVLWLPRTAVGDGCEPGDDGDGDARDADGDPETAALPDETGDADGTADCAPGEEDDVAWDDDAAEDGEVPGLTFGDALDATDDGVVEAWPGSGPSATDRGWAASTATPSVRSPATATIGTMPTRLPSGRGSRQFGQKPETGVVT